MISSTYLIAETINDTFLAHIILLAFSVPVRSTDIPKVYVPGSDLFPVAHTVPPVSTIVDRLAQAPHEILPG